MNYAAGTAAVSPLEDPSADPSTFSTVDTFSCSSAAGALGSSTGCSEALAWSSSFTALFLFGLRGRCCFLGGVFTSTFSWVLLAELAVGRIIRARKPSSAAFGAPVLVRLFDFSDALDGPGREGREVFLPGFKDAPGGAPREPAIVRSLFSVDGFRPRLLLMLARLGDLEGCAPATLAAEAAVGAVAEAGRRTGRVGDLGLGFDGGEIGVVLLLTFALTDPDVCLGFGAAAVAGLVAKEDRLGFSPVDSLDGLLRGFLDDVGCLDDRDGCLGEGVVEEDFLPGVFGVLGVGADLTADVGLEAVEEEVASLLVDMVEGRDPGAFAFAVGADLAKLASLGLPFGLVGVACVLRFTGEADCSDADDGAGTDAVGLSCDSG